MAVQYAVVRNNDRCRAGFLIIVCLFATVLQAFGTGYYQIAPNNTNDGAYITLWDVSLCNAGTCAYPTTVSNFTVCNQWAIILKAAAAFYVMACVVVYFALVFAFLEFFAVGIQVIGVVLAIIYVILSVIGWAIIAGFYRGSYCGFVLSDSHRLHAGWACAVAGSGLVFIGVIFWLIRYCCCNPNKVRFSQAAASPMVTGVASMPITYAAPAPMYSPMASPACVTAPFNYASPMARVTAVNYASPVARVAGPVVTASAPTFVSAVNPSRMVSPGRW